MALLLLVSGLGGPGGAPAQAVGLVAGPPIALDCAAHGEDRGPAPLAHCAYCCILCDGACPLGAARDAMDAATWRLPPASDAPGAPPAASGAGGLDRRPPGWASSWSSQAPPRFS
ncbi:hypothetical protein [Methylosinus sp. Sm6]|uniref:hypothetical protein n=1 Tax=Methylosinus sp. Sm6 TaxID=2866948 RepID=UPI001C995C8F|nr:hypothetical protein [Methylosinus sp. Sm6]MBY6240829.1 hypothetical protein [Methylosinus sp. Sm6]